MVWSSFRPIAGQFLGFEAIDRLTGLMIGHRNDRFRLALW